MIVEPDFLDHWKTRLLTRLLTDERAPLYVLRLWAHCQQRKTDRFTGWNPDVLASVCRWDGDGVALWEAMGKTFLEIQGENVVVHGWAETNAALLSAWSNGKLGGRPKAVKSGVTKPTGNPPVDPPQAHRVSDREEKRRSDGGDGIEKRESSTAGNDGGTWPTLTEVKAAASMQGIPPAVADAFWNHFEAQGWQTKDGLPIIRWQPKLTSWWVNEQARAAKDAAKANGTGYRRAPLDRTPDDEAF